MKARLVARPERLWSLAEMERTGGEPDVVGQDPKTSEYRFFAGSAESPRGPASVCYDWEPLDSRKVGARANCSDSARSSRFPVRPMGTSGSTS